VDNEPSRLLTTRQAAERCGVTVQTVNRWVRENRLTPAVQGEGSTGTRFYRQADVDALAAHAAA
jgi:excisionase family DNA binding protein